MDLAEITAISRLGMDFESMRIQVASTNIAFANQLASSPEQVFQPLQVSLNGAQMVSGQGIDIADYISNLSSVARISVEQNASLTMKYDPENALADVSGFVYKPDVNIVNEMLVLTEAKRAYEANIRAFNTAREMSAQARQIGK